MKVTVGRGHSSGREVRARPSAYLHPFDVWVRDHYWAVILTIFVCTTGYLALRGSLQFGREDSGRTLLSLIATSALVLAIGLWLGLKSIDRIYETIDRLSGRGVLVGDPSALKDLMAARGRWGATVGGPVVAGVMLAVFSFVMRPPWVVHSWESASDRADEWLVTVYAVVFGYIVGRLMGRAVVYGTLGLVISRRGDWSIHPQRNSPDGASGLAPVGAMYFSNSGILLIPAAYFAAHIYGWAIARPGCLSEREARLEAAPEGVWVEAPLCNYGWRDPFLWMLALTLLLQLPVTILPLLSFRSPMKNSCRVWREEVDQAAIPRLAGVESVLLHCDDQERQRELRDEQALLRDQFATVKRCPTWPVDPSIRRRFAISNVLLVIPLIVNPLSSNTPQSFWEWLDTILGGLGYG
jgi:hypothetical protein